MRCLDTEKEHTIVVVDTDGPKKEYAGGWRNGLTCKPAYCSLRESSSSSQHPDWLLTSACDSRSRGNSAPFRYVWSPIFTSV